MSEFIYRFCLHLHGNELTKNCKLSMLMCNMHPGLELKAAFASAASISKCAIHTLAHRDRGER